MDSILSREQLVNELIDLQRNRVAYLKSAIMIGNQLRAHVASSDGYRGGQTEAEERKAYFERADKIIKAVSEGEDSDHVMVPFIQATNHVLELYQNKVTAINKLVEKVAKRLHPRVVEWVGKKEQAGFGLRFLGIIVGECGDLENYSGPMKLWKRMGLAPFTSKDKTLAGSTWKSGRQGKLSAEEWEEFGYNPRRRSIAFLISDALIKSGANAFGKGMPGPYYVYFKKIKDEVAPAKHPDWTPKHCEMHARLLMTKLLLKELWAVWNGKLPSSEYKPLVGSTAKTGR